MISINTFEIKKGDRVKVDFTHVPDKGQSNFHFSGNGTVDLFEDNRVFGRLDDGRPFCCLTTDIELLDPKNLVGHDESKAINKTFLFLLLVLGCAIAKGCGQ